MKFLSKTLLAVCMPVFMTSLASALAPMVLTHPESQMIQTGGSATLSVMVDVSGPLTYQWKKNGVDIPSSNSSNYALSNSQGTDAGSYTVVVTNVDGSCEAGPAAVFVGTRRTLFVRASAVGSNNGTSWTNAYTSLSTALANALDGDDIWVAAGTYLPSTTGNRDATFTVAKFVRLFGGFSGTETAIEQRNWNAHVTTLSGDLSGNDTGLGGNQGDNSKRVVTVSSSSGAVIDGFTVRSGSNTTPAQQPDFGAGIGFLSGGYGSMASSAVVRNCLFKWNSAMSYGGAVGLWGTSSTPLTIQSCVFIQNSAPANGGGAIQIDNCPLVIRDCLFDRNSTGGSGGGSITANNTRDIVVFNSVFSNNTAASETGAGGIRAWTSNAARYRIVQSTFYSNTGPRGAVYFEDTPQNSNCLFANSIIVGSGASPVTFPNTTYLLSDQTITGTGNSVDTPQFVNAALPLGADGVFGSLDDGFALQPGSPGINTGSNSLIPLVVIMDVTGQSRIHQQVDVGAYEHQQLTNGDFEVPALSVSGGLEVTGTEVMGWTKTGPGELNLIRNLAANLVAPKSGAQQLLFNSGDLSVGAILTTTIPTVVGKQYQVQFHLGRVGPGAGNMGITSRVRDISDNLLYNNRFQAPTTQAYGPISGFSFTATSNFSILSFEDTSLSTASVDVLLDSISILESIAITISSPISTFITATGVTLGGSVISDGGAVITERGIVYSATSTNADPLIGSTGVIKVTTPGTTGLFTVPVSGLTQGTGYSYKAYATNSQGTSYTSVGTFTTLSTNANLSSLTLGRGPLNPTFSSATTTYTASVTNPISAITVTPTRAQNNATIAVRVNGGSYASVTSGSPSGSLVLNVGSNTVDVRVTAQDGLTQKIYTVTVTRAKAPQTITFASISDKLTTDVLNLTASGGGSGNPVTFTLTAGPASLIDNVLTFTTSGSVTITASQVGNANYLDAPNVVRTFTVSKATAPIAFSQTVQLSNGTPRPVTVSTTPLGLSAVLSYAGTPSAPVLPGAYNVIATIQDLIYQGTGSTSLTVLGITAPDFGRVTLGQVGIQTFTLSNPGLTALSLTGNPLVKILGEHASDFEVSMPPATEIPAGGSVNFEIRFAPTQPAERQAVVQMAFAAPGNSPINFPIQGFGALSSLMAQTISFSAPASVYLSQGPLALTAIASSGLPVTFTLISGPAALQGNLLTLNGPGTVKVEARQPGRGNYASARPVQRTITVKADPTALTLGNLSQVYDGTPRPITVLGVEDATVSYRYPDGLDRSQPPTAAGSYPVSAFAAGILRKDTLVITRAPLIVQPNDQSKHLGEPNPELEVTFSGLVTGETSASVLFRPITVTTTAKDSSPPGVYPITSRGGSAANYTLIHRPGKLVIEGYVGSFEALLRDPNTSLPAGLVKVTVPAASRSASAKLMLGIESAPLSFAGPLALDAETRVASGQFSRVVRSTDTYTLNLTVNVFGELNCEVRRNGVLIATATDGIRLRDKIKGETMPQAGAYTGEMELGQSAGPNDPSAPGWTTAKVDAGGTMALTGRLGDGTAFTASLPADLRGGYRFFAQPYRPARAGAHVGGLWALAPHPITSGRWKLDGAELTWAKAARDLDPSYRAGFGPLTLAFSMHPWQPSSKTVALMQLLGVDQWTVSYSPTGSASESSLPNLVSLNSNNTFQVLAPVTSPANIRRWTSRVNPSTGAFTGSFELLDVTQRRTVNFSGVLRQGNDVQVSQQGRGHYLLPPLKSAANQESRTGGIRFLRVPE